MLALWLPIVAMFEVIVAGTAFYLGRSYQLSQDTEQASRKMKER